MKAPAVLLRPGPAVLASSAALLLFFGGAIYLLCRPTNLQMFGWLQTIGMLDDLLTLRLALAPALLTVPAWVVQSLPAALWTCTGTLFLRVIWRNDRSVIQLIWLVLFLGLAFVPECLQATESIPGTFDPCDLALSIAGATAGLILTPGTRKELNHEASYPPKRDVGHRCATACCSCSGKL